jgi:hypothetical protein
MADPKRRDRPKGSELRESLKSNPEQSYRRARRAKQLPDRFTEQDLRVITAAAPGMGAIGAEAADVAGSIDPYLSRNEFKEGFYDQPKPPVSYETLKGTAAKPIPNITDTESFADGGSVRGQKNIQVKKKQFRGVF